MMRGMRHGMMLLAAGTIAGTAAGAQTPSRLPPGAVVQPMVDNGAELRRHLTTLADNPRSLDALIGAGRAALATGDAEAALNFFGRAEQISPRDARVKAGMASCFAHLGRAPAALNLFAEAVALGAPVVEIAGDRGLAYDMVGDLRRAQQDYVISLRHRQDPEVQRRLALSLAISGEQEAALNVIAAQLRRNERAAWRTQALVLALTGDAAGATRTAQGTMPPGAASAMAPFLAALPGLSPQQKAMAVHFGHFPTAGRGQGAWRGDTSADPTALALAMGGAAPAPRTAASPPEAEPAATRRRPGGRRGSSASRRRNTEVRDSGDPYRLRSRTQTARRESRAAPPARSSAREAAPAAERPATEIAQVNTRWAGAPVIPPQAQAAAPPPPAQAPAAQLPAVAAPSPAPQQQGLVMTPTPAPPPVTVRQADPEAVPVASPGFSLAERQPDAPAASEAPPREPLADIESVVAALPSEEPPARRPEPVRTAERAAEPARPSRGRTAQPAHPRRHWVQIAGGADRSALPREFARLRAQAAELAGRTAWTTPLNATNRLLVGPFASASEAQEFVNRLAQRDVAAFAWTSPAGQEVERLPTPR